VFAAMARSQRIWVVDDDPELGRMLAAYLGDQGYEVRILHDGAQLLARLQGRLGGERPDLLVLDLMLPGEDGLQLLRRLRDGGDDLPVVMLTARADAVDRIIGLEQGADDYLGKPFLPRELTARIEAVLRRRVSFAAAGGPIATAEPVHFGDCVLDPAARRLERAGLAVPITSGEFALLVVFVGHPHRPLSRQQLIELARGPASETDSRSMDVQVSRLRRLIESDPARPRYLQTVWGYGYVFVPDGRPRAH
jgi:two-component system phosphate regulon response regulator OmpR